MCLEDYLFNFYDKNKADFVQQLTRVENLNYSSMPESIQKSLEKNLKNAGSILEIKNEIQSAKKEMAAASIAYKPIHTEVRTIERVIRQNKKQIKALKLELRAVDNPTKKAAIKQDIVAFENEIAEQQSLIPQTWNQTNKDFKLITTRLNRARLQFRRISDQAYSEVKMVITAVDAEPALSQIGKEIRLIRSKIKDNAPEKTVLEIKNAYSRLNKIPGANEASKSLSKARKAIDNEKHDYNKAMNYIDATLAIIEGEAAWRKEIKSGPYKDLVSFEKFTQNNLGLREQERLTSEQVDIITPCLAKHRNISLQF